MAECCICYEPLFKYADPPAPPRQRSRRPPPPPPVSTEPLSVCATKCGHVYHDVCLSKWFASSNRRECPLCRDQRPADPTRLIFSGDPWASEVDTALKSVLARSARRLAEKAGEEAGVGSSGAYMQGLAGQVGDMLTAVKTTAEDEQSQEVWLSLVQDPELKDALSSLSSSLSTLKSKLHYTHNIDSLKQTIQKYESDRASHSNALRAVEAAHEKALEEYKTKTIDKMERERRRWKENEKEKEIEWKAKLKGNEAKVTLTEQRVREEIAEKKLLRESTESLNSSLNTRIAALGSLQQKNAKLTSRLELANQEKEVLQAQVRALETKITLVQASKRSRYAPAEPWDDEDEMVMDPDDSMAIYDDENEEDDEDEERAYGQGQAAEESLEVTMNDISWRSDPDCFPVTGKMRPFGQKPSKLRQTNTLPASSTSNPPRPTPLRSSPSANRPSPTPSPPPKPQSSFKSGPRHAPPPSKPKPVPAAKKARLEGGQMRLDFGQSSALATGPRMRKKIDVVGGVL